MNENQAVYPNNIISLANAAGFTTHWLSTQPTGHDADTAASRVGIQAKFSKFYEPNAPREGIGTFNDTVVLDGLKEVLSKRKQSQEPALYVFHINGSHPDFCKRLIQPVSEKFKNQKMACYLETLKQTDTLIENIVQELKPYGSYSLIYLSDHGLAHVNKDSADVTLINSPKHKQAYHVPFVRISSNDKGQIRQQAERSGFHFIYGFAEWLGIDETKLKLPYKFFSEVQASEGIKVFDWEKIVPYESLEDDPVLMP
ncbi:sulfatase-like hydrolase/transferase [Neisseria weixii]|nr:sulfatase-like hydrolase/transferase [Neisseria weixii]